MSYEEPNDEQLARFAAVTLLGPTSTDTEQEMIRRFIRTFPSARERWLDLHRHAQEQIDALSSNPNSPEE